MSRIVGIDLGTTNSLIAYMDGRTPRVIAGRHDRTMVPSVVAMTDNGLMVGDGAKEHLLRDPARTIYSVKRFMGKALAERFAAAQQTHLEGVRRLFIAHLDPAHQDALAEVLKKAAGTDTSHV